MNITEIRDCECPWRTQNAAHGCSVRPTQEYAVNMVPLWLCAECATIADIYDAEHKKHGISFRKTPA